MKKILVEQVTLHGEKEDIYFRTEADRDTFLKEYERLDDSAKGQFLPPWLQVLHFSPGSYAPHSI